MVQHMFLSGMIEKKNCFTEHWDFPFFYIHSSINFNNLFGSSLSIRVYNCKVEYAWYVHDPQSSWKHGANVKMGWVWMNNKWYHYVHCCDLRSAHLLSFKNQVCTVQQWNFLRSVKLEITNWLIQFISNIFSLEEDHASFFSSSNLHLFSFGEPVPTGAPNSCFWLTAVKLDEGFFFCSSSILRSCIMHSEMLFC